ncbi:PilC/PilY family type IV pilus protein [Aquabacterium sp.]|uniref:PilC/PilY family type IV pilus protein n=1 Tax=Aquabacterium sp. TaxID=1872578 RepID=UPI0025BA054F|nr:PilC/PilY family type IV pilus protein [Aquabacterium sp.]
MKHTRTTLLGTLLAPLLGLGLGLLPGQASRAAATDISQVPLITSKTLAKPNILFILDDSGSMDWEFMPDDMSNSGTYGYKSAQCNGVAFNPNLDYTTPKTHDGRSFPSMSLDASWHNGFAPTLKPSFSSTYATTSSNSFSVNDSGAISFSVGSVSNLNVNDQISIVSRSDNAVWMTGQITQISGTTITVMRGYASTSSTASYNSWDVAPIARSTTNLTLGDSGSITLTVTPSSHLAVGQRIGIQSQANAAAWMTGTITAKSGDTLTVSRTAGTDFHSSTGSAANWHVSQLVTKSLVNATYYQYSSTTPQPALNWRYTSTGVDSSTDFYQQCMSQVGNSPGNSVFTLVTVGSSSTSATRYANWYAFYRKRIYTMKTAASQAFSGLDDYKRVGFSRISDPTVGAAKFLNVGDFDSTQKIQFFGHLFRTPPNSNTPLRGALSKAGRYYANKVSGQTADPVQYACQRNYSVLSTDGYWNTGSEITNQGASGNYGAYQLDNTTLVGNTDKSEKRPMYDGTAVVLTTVTVTTTTSPRLQIVTSTPVNQVYERIAYTGTGTKGAGSCSKTQYRYVAYRQQRTQVSYTKQTRVVSAVTTSTRTVVTSNGTVTSDNTVEQRTISATESDSGVSVDTSKPIEPGTYANVTGSGYTYCASSLLTASQRYTTEAPSGSPFNGSPTDTPTNLVTPTVDYGEPTVTSQTYSGGHTNTLADVAQYYYSGPLRSSTLGNCTLSTGDDGCGADVTASGLDSNTRQHMTTFTIGMGVSGTLAYDANYQTQTSGTYVSLTNGSIMWPAPGNGEEAPNIDDLWHAAINGRGRYFSAADPTALSNALNGIFQDVDKANGAGTSAATSSLRPVSGTDQVYLASYTTQDWTGEVVAQDFTYDNRGNVTLNNAWSASAGLNTLTSTTAATRKVYYMRSTSQEGTTTHSLVNFTYANLDTDNLGSHVSDFCNRSPQPAQCSGLSSTVPPGQTLSPLGRANLGTNLVNYLRGDPSMEISSGNTYPLYRKRVSRLGDIVGGSPVFVGVPVFDYGDLGYAAYKTANVSRKPMLYVAANDGMLHAFSAQKSVDAGTELWSFVPSQVIPNLYRLADSDYAHRHQFYVDAAPVVADVKRADGVWRTILVGGLGAGGKGYYALDITNPESPVALWEFTDAHLGYTHGTPIVTKRADGTWVVVFGSGANNHENGGDGNGHLYMLNALTGAKLLDIPTYTTGTTKAGSSDTPSGLVKLNAWVTDPSNNTALRFYGGDLLGNVWRFDTDGLTEPKNAALRLAKLETTSGKAQPVSTRIELAEVNYGGSTYPVVLTASGRYLGSSDLKDTTTQSVYAIKDPLTASGWGTLRGSTQIVQQTLTASGNTATVSNSPVDWGNKIGWYMDLPQSGERVSVDMALQYNTLAVLTATPSTATCAASGESWLYYFNLNSGGAASADGSTAGEKQGNFLGMGLTWVELSDGSSRLLIPASNATLQIRTPSAGAGAAGSVPHRTSWRELQN